ncbi:hypothetical protein EV426DRAFT_713638 [Tirmania nivea]|nr:hypothetical protein EV426DRAFT_713638 [Tirmania nivea]
MEPTRPRVYATARRAARAGTFGRRNLTGRHASHAYSHLDTENQPAPGEAAEIPVSNSGKEHEVPASRRSSSNEEAAFLLSGHSEREAVRPTTTFPESSPASSSPPTSVVRPTGPNTPYRYSGSPSPTSPPYYPETPEPETRVPQTPRERSVTRSIKPESPAPQTPTPQTPRARERSLTRSIKQEPLEPFCFSSPTTPSSRENTPFPRENQPENTVYSYITDSIPTKFLVQSLQAGSSTYAGSKRNYHNQEGIGNLEGLFWLSAVYQDASPSTKRRRVEEAESSPAPLPSPSPPKRLVRPTKRVPLEELTFAESSSESESSPSPPSRLLRPVKRSLLGELTFAESSPEAEFPLPVRHLVRPVNRVLLEELGFEKMPKKASTARKRKRASVSASGEGAGQQSPQKRVKGGEQAMEETVRVLVPASSVPVEEEQVENEEERSAEEEERMVVSRATRKTTRKTTRKNAAGPDAATTNPRSKQDAGINVDLGQVNNVLHGTAPAATTRHQNDSSATGSSYDVYDFYDYDMELNIRSKVGRFLENDVAHLVQQSNSIEGACTAITALATQVEDLRKSQKSFDEKFARVSKDIDTSSIEPEVKRNLHHKLRGEVYKVSETINNSLLRVERVMEGITKGAVGAKKQARKVSKKQVTEEENSGKEGERTGEEAVHYVEMARRDVSSQSQRRRPGPPKGSKRTSVEPRASEEEIASNLKKTDGYYALLSRNIMERETELRKARARQNAEFERYEQTLWRVEKVRSETTRGMERENVEELLEWQELESGREKVREDSPEVSVKDEELVEDEQYEDEVNENSPPRDLKKLPAPVPLPRRRLGDGIASTSPQAKAAPARLGSDAPTERVTIPAFGGRRVPGVHTPPPHQQSNNVDEWEYSQVKALFDGVKLFGCIGLHKWAEAIKMWDETGGKGKGRAGEGVAGGERALRGKSVEEIERKGKEVAMGFVEVNGVGEWMEPWRGIL